MVGLYSGTQSKMIVVGGILTIAIADAFSDALGIHFSEESENKHSTKEIWEATIATFLTKAVIALTFIVPILFFNLSQAVLINIIWGLTVLSIFSFIVAKKQKRSPGKAVLEHLIISLAVILITYFVGNLISGYF